MIRHPLSSRSRRLRLDAFSRADRLADALDRTLDDGFHWFRRVAPGGMEPIEAVVVGIGGTWTITHATGRGRFRHRNGHWYRWNGRTESWVPWEAGVVNAARLAARRLSLYLERAAQPADVTAVLVPDRGTEVSWDPGDRLGMLIEPDAERLAARIARDEVLTPAQVDRIAALLDPRQPLPQLATTSPNG
jgi:hypothetical protein